MKKDIEKRKKQLLVELDKNVPQIDWNFKEVKEVKRYLNDGRILEEFDIYFSGVHKESNDSCFIKFDGGRESVLELGFSHISGDPMYKDYIPVIGWDGVNEFFNEFCIGFEERERKIMSGEMKTPNMKEFEYFGNYIMSNVEYSEGFLNLIFQDYSCGSSPKGTIKSIFNGFERDYRDLMKKTKSKEEYEKHYKNKNGYFGTPHEMVKSFLDERFVGELDYRLEDLWKEVEEEELKKI